MVRKRLNWGFNLCDHDIWPLNLTFCVDLTTVISNNSRKFLDDTIMETKWKWCDRRTEQFIELLGRS